MIGQSNKNYGALPNNYNNNTNQLYLKLAKILFTTAEQNNSRNVSLWDHDLPPLRLHYMIDDYEELFGIESHG